MTDAFHEVDEQLRADRTKAAFMRALPWAIGAAALALVATLGYWGYGAYQKNASAKASEFYDAGLRALEAQDRTKAGAEFAKTASSGSRIYRTLGLMQQGQLASDNPVVAAGFFDKAAEQAPWEPMADVARLQAVYALIDTAPYKDIEARLTPLTAEGRAYRLEAREALAFAKLMAGDLPGARTAFNALTLTAGAPQGLKDRAGAAVAMIDSGSAAGMPAAVRAALQPPPPVVAPPQTPVQ